MALTSGIALFTEWCLLLWNSPSHPPRINHSPLAHWKNKEIQNAHSGLRGQLKTISFCSGLVAYVQHNHVKKVVGVLSSLERLGKFNTLSKSDLTTSEKSDSVCHRSFVCEF